MTLLADRFRQLAQPQTVVANPAFVAEGVYAVVGIADLTLTLPAGIVTGDLLIAMLETRNNETDPTPTSDWTSFPAIHVDDSLASQNFKTAHHTYFQSYTGTAPNLTFPGNTDHLSGVIVAYRNVASVGTPVTDFTDLNITAHTQPGVTTTQANSIVLFGYSLAFNRTVSNKAIANVTIDNDNDHNHTTNGNGHLGWASGDLAIAGPSGDLTFNTNNNVRASSMAIELKG